LHFPKVDIKSQTQKKGFSSKIVKFMNLSQYSNQQTNEHIFQNERLSQRISQITLMENISFKEKSFYLTRFITSMPDLIGLQN